MFNSNTTNEYNYYDKQGRYIGTKRIVHLSNDAIHSMWLTKYDNGTEDSFHAADELFFYHLHNLANTKNGDTVYLVGGEKSADALAIRGSISVSAPDGADPQKFPSEVVPYFTIATGLLMLSNSLPTIDIATSDKLITITIPYLLPPAEEAFFELYSWPLKDVFLTDFKQHYTRKMSTDIFPIFEKMMKQLGYKFTEVS